MKCAKHFREGSIVLGIVRPVRHVFGTADQVSRVSGETYLEHVFTPPHGIIFVGHSMGGIVIRSLLRSIDFDPRRIAFIVTLGTPHKDARTSISDYILLKKTS